MLVAPYPHSYNSDAPLAEFIFCSIEKGLTADHHQQAPSVRACVQLDFEQSFGASHTLSFSYLSPYLMTLHSCKQNKICTIDHCILASI